MTFTEGKLITFPAHRRRATRLVPLSELIEQYGFSERWWRYRLAEGLPRRRWGRQLRFDLSEVEQWMEERYGAQAG
jgi:predicted DNA-binding transcriptional regulator AlpA